MTSVASMVATIVIITVLSCLGISSTAFVATPITAAGDNVPRIRQQVRSSSPWSSTSAVCVSATSLSPSRTIKKLTEMMMTATTTTTTTEDEEEEEEPTSSSSSLAAEAEDARKVLVQAAKEKNQDPDRVLAAIRFLEKYSKKKEGKVEGKFEKLTTNGNWRLIFTTGEKKTQKNLGGSINYVPIKAVQVFKDDYTITNGIYLGSFALLKFTGTFTWEETTSRLNFNFNQIAVLGLGFPFNQGESKVQPGFTFMDVTSDYVIARGAGGGLALWLRVDEI